MVNQRKAAQAQLLKYTLYSAMRFPRRTATILYGLWVLVEGLFLLGAFLFPRLSGGSMGLEMPVVYLVATCQFAILMQTHTNTTVVVRGVHWMVMAHIIFLLGISLWRFLVGWNAWYMARFVAMSVSIIVSAKETSLWSSIS